MAIVLSDITTDVRQLSGLPEGYEPAKNAAVWFWPYGPWHVEDGGDDFGVSGRVLKRPLVDGVAVVPLPDTPVDNAMWVQLRGVKGYGAPWLVQINGAANLFDLPHIDPDTLNPLTPPSPAWLAALEAVQDDLALKAPTASPTFTGTVSGVTKAHVGLSSADNTADADKPVSTLQAAADAAATAAAQVTSAQKASNLSDLTSTIAARDTLAMSDYSKLLSFYAALANRENACVDIGILGASSVEGAFVSTFSRTISSRLVALLRNRYPTSGSPAGRGFIGVPAGDLTGSAQYTPGMWPMAFTAGTFDPIDPGASAFDIGPKHMCWYTNTSVGTPKVVLTLDGPISSFDIHHAVGASGGASAGYYKIDGGAAVPFSTFTGAPSPLHVASAATTSIEVGHNNAGFLIFTGITEYAGDENKGIQVHNLGHSGFTIAEWQDGYTVANSWRSAIAGMNLDLLILGDLGANDAFGGMTPAQVKTALLAFIVILRAGGITCPILLAALFDPVGGASIPAAWSQYATAMREIADTDATIRFVDHSARIPSSATDPLGIFSTVDHVHARPTGALTAWQAQTYAHALTPA